MVMHSKKRGCFYLTHDKSADYLLNQINRSECDSGMKFLLAATCVNLSV